jgi:hypothetical protein
MVANCGTAKWCVISHVDVVFYADTLTWMRRHMADNVGIVGTHCPIMGVNRLAYQNRGIGFNPDHCNDVGIKLEKDLESKGWRHQKFDYAAMKTLHHFGGGSSHHTKEEFLSMRRRAMAMDIEYGLKYDGLNMDQILANGTQINIIHFMGNVLVPPLSTEQEGPPSTQLRIVCMPHMTEWHKTDYHPNYLRSEDPRAANCPACKRTKVFADAMAALNQNLAGRHR